jgi:hypothetical protein
MPTVTFRFEADRHNLIRELELECSFLPQVGDVVNAYDMFDDVEVQSPEGWGFIVHKIDWELKQGTYLPKVRLFPCAKTERRRIMDVHFERVK